MQKQIVELIDRWNKSRRLSGFAISDTGFLFDPVTGQSFTLNHTGLIALNCLRHGESIESTAEHLSREYNVSADVALNSVESFLLQLGRYF